MFFGGNDFKTVAPEKSLASYAVVDIGLVKISTRNNNWINRSIFIL